MLRAESPQLVAEHPSDDQGVPGTGGFSLSSQPLRFWWIGASAIFVCVGSMGPWAKFLFITVNGLDGDGSLTLVCGLAALVLLVVYVRVAGRPRPVWPLAVVLLAGLVAAGVGIYDWSQIEKVIGDSGGGEDFVDLATVSVGWGLVVMTLASASLVVAAIVTVARRPEETPAARAQPPSA